MGHQKSKQSYKTHGTNKNPIGTQEQEHHLPGP